MNPRFVGFAERHSLRSESEEEGSPYDSFYLDDFEKKERQEHVARADERAAKRHKLRS